MIPSAKNRETQDSTEHPAERKGIVPVRLISDVWFAGIEIFTARQIREEVDIRTRGTSALAEDVGRIGAGGGARGNVAPHGCRKNQQHDGDGDGFGLPDGDRAEPMRQERA